MNTNRKLTELDNINIDAKFQLEHQIQLQETKESGWIIDQIISMKLKLYKTVEINGSIYVKTTLGPNAILNIGNYDEYCFLW